MAAKWGRGLIMAGGLCLSACSHTVYQAQLDGTNADGRPIKTLLYWSKTSPMLGDAKAGPIVLLSECSNRRVDFVDSEQGIVFRGNRGKDRLLGDSAPIQKPSVCGFVVQQPEHRAIPELDAGLLPVTIRCQAVSDAFTVVKPPYTNAYLAPREQAYLFDVKAERYWSFFGEIPQLPPPPECRHP